MLKADAVYLNGNIYCVVPRNRWVEAIAIKDGKFISIGNSEDVKALITSSTEVIDLEGKTVLPGLHEMHIHALRGALKELNECHLPANPTSTLQDILNSVQAYAQENPHKRWIIGGNWEPKLISQLHKSSLDAIEPDRPILLFDFSTHNAWVNSKALEISGINSRIPDPEGGRIIRDESGEPTGILIENAVNIIHKHVPQATQEELIHAGEWLTHRMNSYGITAIKEPNVDNSTLDVYDKLAKNDRLTLRLAACLMWKCKYGTNVSFNEQFELIQNRGEYASERINPHFAKMYLDGVPAFKTAAFLEPYEGDRTESHDPYAMLLVNREELRKDLIFLDKEGITVKMHATGDAAVRVALDAIEAARAHNGFSGLRHEIAHSGFIHPDDMMRFKALDTVAEFSPPFWYPSVLHDKTKILVLGRERANSNYPCRSMMNTGALAICGSDWPIAPHPNPWYAMEALVTRRNPYEDYPGVLNEKEAVDLADAIEMFTINGALSMYTDNVTGSIQVGKSADMIVLDRNPFNIPAEEIHNIHVLTTLLEGEVVYENN